MVVLLRMSWLVIGGAYCGSNEWWWCGVGGYHPVTYMHTYILLCPHIPKLTAAAIQTFKPSDIMPMKHSNLHGPSASKHSHIQAFSPHSYYYNTPNMHAFRWICPTFKHFTHSNPPTLQPSNIPPFRHSMVCWELEHTCKWCILWPLNVWSLVCWKCLQRGLGSCTFWMFELWEREHS